jgi:LuxR family maltose regulon positive regulatory protein
VTSLSPSPTGGGAGRESTVPFFGAPRRSPHLIRRPRLEARLDEGAMITTISAGAGSGKTALLATWVSASAVNGVWVDASTAPGDRVSFWRHTFDLLAEAAGRDGDEALRDTVLATSSTLADATVSTAVARLARSAGSMVVVVDNAHLLDLDAVGPDLVALARFSTGARIIVADRRRRFRPELLASDVDEVRLASDDLLLDADETARVIDATRTRHRLRGRIDAAEVLRLTGGIAGLTRQLVAHGTTRPERSDDPDLLVAWMSDARRILRDARAAATPDAAAPHAKGAVAGAPATDRLETGAVPAAHLLALLGSATPEEAARLASVPSDAAAAVLDSAADHGLGGWHGEGRSASFTFAPLVTRAAAAVVARSASADERRRVAARLAQAHAVRGEATTAFCLAIDAGDFDLAVAIGKRSFLQMIKDDTPALLQRLRRVPLTRLRRHPLLILFLAMLHAQSPRGRAAAILHFGLAERLARATEATASPEDRAVMVGVRNASMRMQGAFDKAVPVAREFLERFDALTPEEQDRLSSLSRHLLWQVAHTLFFAGETDAAVGATQRMLAVPVPEDLVEDRGIQPALTLMAAVQATVGSITSARETLAEAARHPRRSSPFYAVWERTADALSAIERGEFDAAVGLLDSLDHAVDDGEYWPVDVVVRAMGEAGAGRAPDALRRIEAVLDADSPPRQAAAARDLVVVLRAILSAAVRPAGEAALVLRHVSRTGALSALAESVVALRGGDPVRALGLAGQASGEPSVPRVRAAALLVRAASCLALGQEEAVARAARDALGILETESLSTPWVLLTADERVAITALVEGQASDVTRERLARMPVLFHVRAHVERLTERERAVLARLVAGDTIPQVAEASGVSSNTIKTQRARIYRKLGVDNRADAARVALENDLL